MAPEIRDVPRPDLRSHPSRRLTFVRFENATQRKVDVIWINYEGVRVKYKMLEPGQFFDANTYVKHPWIFQDALTHEPLVVKASPIFQPGPWYEPFLPALRSGKLHLKELQPKRIQVFITIPIYSLREMAARAIKRQLVRPEDALQLEIPRQLQEDLMKSNFESNHS